MKPGTLVESAVSNVRGVVLEHAPGRPFSKPRTGYAFVKQPKGAGAWEIPLEHPPAYSDQRRPPMSPELARRLRDHLPSSPECDAPHHRVLRELAEELTAAQEEIRARTRYVGRGWNGGETPTPSGCASFDAAQGAMRRAIYAGVLPRPTPQTVGLYTPNRRAYPTEVRPAMSPPAEVRIGRVSLGGWGSFGDASWVFSCVRRRWSLTITSPRETWTVGGMPPALVNEGWAARLILGQHARWQAYLAQRRESGAA